VPAIWNNCGAKKIYSKKKRKNTFSPAGPPYGAGKIPKKGIRVFEGRRRKMETHQILPQNKRGFPGRPQTLKAKHRKKTPKKKPFPREN